MDQLQYTDYKDEFLPRLMQSSTYVRLKELCVERDSDIITTVDLVVSYACQRSKTVVRHMGEYTLHDADHLFRVLHISELLLGEDNVKKLSAPELFLLILSVFLHDIGMAPAERQVQIWKSALSQESFPLANEDENDSLNDFHRFLTTKEEERQSVFKCNRQYLI